MLRLLLSIISVAIFFSCSKKTDDQEQNFSFEFNGKRHSQPGLGGLFVLNGVVEAMVIDGPDIFGGTIYYFANPSSINNCAWLSPVGEQFSMQQPGCIITNRGNPIDSVQLYTYRAGNLDYKKSDCKLKKVRNMVSGGWDEYNECDVTGSFFLTLANKNNKTIEIKNGSFTLYDVRF